MEELNQKCKDCQGPLYRDEKDVEYWKKKVEESKGTDREMSLPKRCYNCRYNKKMNQPK